MKLSDVIDIFNSWNYHIIDNLCFEPYIGSYANPEYFRKVDDFLCNIYNEIGDKIFIRNVKRAQNYCFDCSEIYTLYPDGTLIKGCPHAAKPVVPDECYSCNKIDICKPCQLQKYCSYPHKFAKLIIGEK